MDLEPTDEIVVDLQPFAGMIIADEPDEHDHTGSKVQL